MSERARRVLVVKDDEFSRATVVEALRDEGYDVRKASDGLEALDWTPSWVPDLIVLNLMMPGMDGWTFLDAPARRWPIAGVPVLVLTAS